MAATLTQSDIIEGQNIGVPTYLYKKTLTFGAGSPAADLATTSIGTSFSGFLSAVRVLFGATAPNTLTVTVSDSDGNTLVTGTVTASGSLDMEGATPAFVNGLSVAISGNTTANATAAITIVFFN